MLTNSWVKDPFSSLTKSCLRNGLQILSIHIPDCPFERIRFIVHAGSRYDEEKYGLAHFMEHLPSSNIPGMSFIEALQYFAENGDTDVYLGGTSFESTQYEFRAPLEEGLKKIKRGVDIFGSMLINNPLELQVEVQRKIIIREIEQKLDDLGALQVKKIADRHKVLFKGHRLETFILNCGTVESVKKITHEEILNFYNHYYVPGNMTIVAVGGLKEDSLLKILQNSKFGEFKSGFKRTCNPAYKPQYSDNQPMFNYRASEYISKPQDLAHYRIDTLLPVETDEINIRLASYILNAILLLKLREELNITYGFSVYRGAYQDHHHISISGDFNTSHADKIECLINECIEQAYESTNLFENGKAAAILEISLSEHSTQGILSSIAGDVVARGNKVRTVTDFLNRYRDSTFEGVKKVIEHLYPRRQVRSLVTP